MTDIQQTPEEVVVLRRQAWLPICVGAVLVLGCWGVYVLASVWEKDVWHGGETPDDTTVTTYRLVAFVATALAVPLVVVGVLKVRRLARGGVSTYATVTGISRVAYHGIGPVTFEYVVDGKRYSMTRDVHVETAALEIGTKVKLVYDPKSPSSAEVLEYMSAS